MRSAVLASLALIAWMNCPKAVVAQTTGLPPPPRSVFKCEVEGKVSYSQEPCLGATRVDLQPTRGLNKSTGKEQIGMDVARERQHEIIAEGLRPVTGMNPDELTRATQRAKLEPKVQRECRAMDTHIARAEAQEKRSAGADLANIQQALYAMRKRHRALGC